MAHLDPTASAARSPWLHRVSLATLLATFPLIFMGGLVTTKGVGMSVPDWPNTYGYNMFLFPPSLWIGGIFYEHTHRLLGTIVGLLAVWMTCSAFGTARNPGPRRVLGWTTLVLTALTVASLAWKLVVGSATAGSTGTTLQKTLPHLFTGFASLALFAGVAWSARSREPRRWVRWLAAAVLLTVIIQGIKGGLRVEVVSIELAIAHGVFAQLILCLIATVCVVTSRFWVSAPDLSAGPSSAQGRQIAIAAFAVFGLVLAQLVVGATMRHLGAGLAIPDLPLAYGKVIPPTTAAGLDTANQARVALNDPSLKPTTLSHIWLHFGHRVGAIIVSAGLLHLCIKTLKRAGGVTKLTFPAWSLLVMLVAQVGLGLATVYFRKPADVTTLHHTVGALILMVTFVLGVRACRLYFPRSEPGPGAEQTAHSATETDSESPTRRGTRKAPALATA